MSSRSILVNFPGYPAEPFGLSPDNGLAQLASVLKDAGHETVVEDFASVSTMDRLFPHAHRADMNRLSERILARLGRGEEPDDGDYRALCALEDEIDLEQDVVAAEMGGNLARRAAGMTRRAALRLHRTRPGLPQAPEPAF